MKSGTSLSLMLPFVVAVAAAAVLLPGAHGTGARSQAQLVNCGTSHDGLNADEAELVGLVQQWRDENVANPGPLQVSGVLNRAAAWYAQWQVDNGVPGGHTDSLGRSWPQRIQDCGYTGFWYLGSGEAVTGVQSQGGVNDSRMYIWPDDALRQMTYPGSGLWNPGTASSPVKCIGVAVVQQEPGGRAVSWVVVVMQFDKGLDCPEANVPVEPAPVRANHLSALGANGSIYLFGRDDANELWYREVSGGTFSPWSAAGALGAVAGRPVAVGRPDGSVVVFYRGPSGDLRFSQLDQGASAWVHGSLGGQVVGDPVVAADVHGDIVLVATGSGGALWVRRLPAGASQFGQWTQIDGAFPGAVMVLAQHQGDLHLFGLDQFSGAWTRTWEAESDSWGSWTYLGGYITSQDLTAVSDGVALHFLVLGGDGSPYYRTYGDSWSAWMAMDGALNGAIAAVRTGSTLLAAGVNADGASWSRTSADGSTWSTWDALGGVVVTTPELVADGVGVHYFAQGQDGAVWHRYWDGLTWDPWKGLGGVLATQ